MTEEKSWKYIIEPKSGWFDIDVKGLWHYKDLIGLFVRRTFVAQYKQTVLGPAWAVIQPLFTTVVYTLIFGNIAGLGAAGVPNFIFYLSGNVIWGFFSGCFTLTAGTFTTNSKILGKVYFPRLVMPISTVLSQLISFAIQFVFMICFLVYYAITNDAVNPNLYMLLMPVILLQFGLLGLGFGTIVSALTTKYRDLMMLITFGINLWNYASPVAYDMFSRSGIAPGERLYGLYMLNPVTPGINVFRYAFLGIGEIDWMFWLISWAVTLVVLFAGVIMFSRIEKTFMDTI